MLVVVLVLDLLGFWAKKRVPILQEFFCSASFSAGPEFSSTSTTTSTSTSRLTFVSRLSALLDDGESSEPQGLYRIGQLLVSNQDVVCFVSGDGENAYVGLRKRNSHRNENPNKIQIERTLYFKSSPASTCMRATRHEVIFANHRKFVAGAAD